MSLRNLIIIIVLCLSFGFVNGQELNKAPNPDSAKVTKKPLSAPKKAALFSLFPGGGQIYNKKYWKVPVIYVGFAALIYSYNFYSNEFNRVRQAYIQSINNQPVTYPEYANVPQDMLYNVRESYKKSRDLSAIGMAGLFAINMIDAAVDAHLKGFDVSDKLSLKIKPGFQYSPDYVFMGFNLKLDIHEKDKNKRRFL